MTDESKRTKAFREQTLVYPKFQFPLILTNCFTQLASWGLVVYLISSAFSKLGSTANTQTQLGTLIVAVSAVYAFSTLIVTLTSLHLSHRLVGPLLNLRGFLDRLVADKTSKTRLSFREGDFFSDIPEKLNNVLNLPETATQSESPSQSDNRENVIPLRKAS